MLQNQKPGANTASCSFINRLHHDSAFRALLEKDTPAALHAVGIALPNRVQVHYAHNATVAIQMALNRTPTAVEQELSDSKLEGVTGGVARSNHRQDEIQHFLSLLKQRSS